MRRLLMPAFAGLALIALPALAATDADCEARWRQADANNDGVLSGAEAIRYAAFLRIGSKEVSADGTISKALFFEHCKTEVFAATAVDPGAPLEGANSFTEGQAQDRILAAGYTDVSALSKDEKGIWRGTASKDGTSVKIAVDYKGNVVVN